MSPYLVIIPTYNEIENIDAILSTTMKLQCNCDVLVVDDGSPDGTAQRVKIYMTDYPGRVFLMERTEKSGLGKAYIAGFEWGLKHGYQCIAEMDADFSHPPEKLNEMFSICSEGKADVCIGSRYIHGGGVVNWPWYRLILSKGASWYVRLITGMPVKDPTAGFVCYRDSVLRDIPLNTIQFVGYGFQIEMKYNAYQSGFRLKEIPILFPDRLKGKSKMNILIIREALIGVFKLKWKRK